MSTMPNYFNLGEFLLKVQQNFYVKFLVVVSSCENMKVRTTVRLSLGNLELHLDYIVQKNKGGDKISALGESKVYVGTLGYYT